MAQAPGCRAKPGTVDGRCRPGTACLYTGRGLVIQYQGGKARLAKFFAPFIEEALARTEGRLYEPFTGGFNIQPALRPGSVVRAINGDAHRGLIVMFQALQAGTWDPPEVLEREEWHALKDERDWTKPVTAFAAFGCSFRAYEFGGYGYDAKGGFAGRARRGLIRKRLAMGPVEFRWADFQVAAATELARDPMLEPWTIYADPPYANTTGYLSGTGFDHQCFYHWVGSMADAGHSVLISEFTPPEGVEYDVVWRKPRHVSGTAAGSQRVEEVYRVHRSKR